MKMSHMNQLHVMLWLMQTYNEKLGGSRMSLTKLYHIMLYQVWGERGKRSEWFSNTHDCFYKVADTKHKLKLRILNVTMQNQSIIIEN